MAPPAGLTHASAAGGDAPWLTRIAVKSVSKIVIVPVASIVRLEAEDNYVRLWADRAYLHKETLTGLMARLDPLEFLRIHRSHAVNVRHVRELRGGEAAEFDTRPPHAIEAAGGRGVELLALFGPQGERLHVRGTTRSG